MNATTEAEEDNEGPTNAELYADWLADQEEEKLLAAMSEEDRAAYYLRMRIENEEAEGRTYYPDFAALLAAYVAGADLPPIERPSMRFFTWKNVAGRTFLNSQRGPHSASPRGSIGRVGGAIR